MSNDKSNESDMPETTTFNGVCARDKAFAEHTARVWAFDLAWEDIHYNIPWCDQQSPIPAPPDMVPFSRHFREAADVSRRMLSRDWIFNGHTYNPPRRIEHY